MKIQCVFTRSAVTQFLPEGVVPEPKSEVAETGTDRATHAVRFTRSSTLGLRAGCLRSDE